MPSPLRNRGITPVSTQHGAPGERENRDERVPLPTGVPDIPHLRQNLDLRT